MSSNTFVDAQYYVRITFAQIISLWNIDIFFISSTKANYPREPGIYINYTNLLKAAQWGALKLLKAAQWGPYKTQKAAQYGPIK